MRIPPITMLSGVPALIAAFSRSCDNVARVALVAREDLNRLERWIEVSFLSPHAFIENFLLRSSF